MEDNKKKIMFILILAILIVIGSFYSFWQKHSVDEQVSTGEVLAKESKGKDDKPSEMIIYISGAVHKPGVFRVTHQARVIDVVTLAGGLAPEADVSKINLAQVVKDGMHIHVAATVILPVESSGIHHGAKAKVGDKVNINTGDKNELDQLPGIGPALAERIIEYRQEKGSFSEIEGLKKVPGIGSSKFEKIKDKITI